MSARAPWWWIVAALVAALLDARDEHRAEVAQ